MFMKKVGWFSNFKMIKYADNFKSILENPPRYADRETRRYYKD